MTLLEVQDLASELFDVELNTITQFDVVEMEAYLYKRIGEAPAPFVVYGLLLRKFYTPEIDDEQFGHKMFNMFRSFGYLGC